MKIIDPLEVYLSEIDYSCSPGGINQWEMLVRLPRPLKGINSKETAYFSEFDTLNDALEFLMKHYPKREINVNIKSLEWYFANEERLENVGV